MESGSHTTDTLRRFESFFLRFDELMETDGAAALRHLEEASDDIRELDEWALCRGEALASAKGDDSAVAWYEALLQEFPGFSDAHYRLSELYEKLGNLERSRFHQFATLRLDAAQDEISSAIGAETLERMTAVAGATLADLPEPIKSRLGQVPVFLADRPTMTMVESGIDARSLGLFTGPSQTEVEDTNSSFEPPQITLFTRCLWDAFGLDEEELLDEVRVTVLHELGHYLGLDEEELESLGLG